MGFLTRMGKFLLECFRNWFWLIPLPFMSGIAFWGSRHMLPDGRLSVSCVVMGVLALVSMGVNILWFFGCRKKREER